MEHSSIEHQPYIIFLSGASGAGKTTLVNELNKKLNNTSARCFHFDSIGVPSEMEMIEKYGSPTEWQKAMTHFWIEKLVKEYDDKKLLIIEGQVNLSFIVTAFTDIHFKKYKIILVHCDNSVRHVRLHVDRNQPELINDRMDNWSSFLKTQAIEMNIPILDTTAMSIENMIDWFFKFINRLLIFIPAERS